MAIWANLKVVFNNFFLRLKMVEFLARFEKGSKTPVLSCKTNFENLKANNLKHFSRLLNGKSYPKSTVNRITTQRHLHLAIILKLIVAKFYQKLSL